MSHNGRMRDMRGILEQLPTLEAAIAAQGIRGDNIEALLWPAAVGATQLLWRNTAVEDWHAEADGLDDGEMMRTNAATVRLVRDLLAAGKPWRKVADAATSPDRVLPDGRTLESTPKRDCFGFAGRRWLRAACSPVSRRPSTAGHRSLWLPPSPCGAAATGTAGMPSWPARVDAFCRAIQDPRDPHWELMPLERIGPRPAQIQDVGDLRAKLLDGPDQLSAESAGWCIRAMLGYVRP